MCVLDDGLFVADNTRIFRYPIKGNQPLQPIAIPYAKKLNDMVADGKVVYVSDLDTRAIFKVDPKTGFTVIEGPPGANGIAFDKAGRMYCASWDNHDVYEVDPRGENPPTALMTTHIAAGSGGS